MARYSKIIHCLSILLLFSAVSGTSCFAGAWTMAAGEFYGRTALNYYSANENFDTDGERVDFTRNGEFYDVNASAYVEYGLSESLSLIGNMAYKYIEYEDDAVRSDTYGLADVELGAKYLLAGGQANAFSIQGLVKIPESYDASETVPLGNGQYDVEARILYGRSLYPMVPGYVNLEAGYRFRAEDPVDEFRYLLEIGGDFTDRCYGRVKLDGILGMEDEKNGRDAGGNPTATAAYDLGKLDMCLGYKMTQTMGVEFGCTPAIYGENTAAGTTWTVAFVFQR